MVDHEHHRGQDGQGTPPELLTLVVPALAIVAVASGFSAFAPAWVTIPLYVVAIAMILIGTVRMSRRQRGRR